METKKYLDRAGLFYMVNKIKGLLIGKANADLSNVDDDVLKAKVGNVGNEDLLNGKADVDLSNVDDDIFKAKVENAGVGDLLNGKANADLSNVDDDTFKAKAESAGVGGDEACGVIDVGTTEGTGEAYSVTIDGINSLKTGLAIILTPHTVSTSTTPTLNVNGLGAKEIRRRLSIQCTTPSAGYAASWLAEGKPVLLIFDGTYWIVIGQSRPVASDLSGVLKISLGGTGNSVADKALANLGGMPIAGGTFTGKAYAGAGAQTAGEYLLRNAKISTTEETPTGEGQICWQCE